MVAGGVCGCWGAYVVAGGHAWLLGGMHGCWGGACVVAGGACMVAGGACVAAGGMHGCRGGVSRLRRDTVNEREVRILLECILV